MSRAVLDANVLFCASLRDTLLRCSVERLFEARWTDDILDEAARNLEARRIMTSRQTERLRTALRSHLFRAWVTGHERHIPFLRNQAKDRHVVAAAVECGAQVIVTMNVADFHPLPDGIAVQTPDDFLADLLERHPDRMVSILAEQAADLRNPPVSLDDLLRGLSTFVPTFVGRVRGIIGKQPK